MAKWVCNRCGAPVGTCDHVHDEDYWEVTQGEFRFNWVMQRALIILIAIIWGLAARQVLTYTKEVAPISTELSIRV